MKSVRQALTVLALLTLVTTVAAQGPPDERIRRVENGLAVVVKGQPARTMKLDERMRELKVPGVSVAVFENGRIAWTRGYGVADVAEGRRVDADTRFQAASLSKPVTSAAVLALASLQQLSLDKDVNHYLKSWKLPANEFNAKQKVTLAHLLSHTGGVTVSGFRGYADGEDVPTVLQVLDGVTPANSKPVRVDIHVGSQFRYAGGGYTIVQLAIQDLTKKPFADALRELVLDPLGMSRSTFVQPLPADLRTKAATGYRASGEPLAGRFYTYPEQAAAGLWTTPADVARFAMAVQQMAAGTSARPIMSRDLAVRMLKPVMGDYGLGVGLIGAGPATFFSHGGSNEGFRCEFIALKDRASGVVVMTNSDRGGVLAKEIIRAVAQEYQWPATALEQGSVQPVALRQK